MKWTHKAKALLMALVMTTAIGAASPAAEAYTYQSEPLGITIDIPEAPKKVQVSGNAAQLLWEAKAIVIQTMPQTMPKAEIDEYLAKTDTEVKQQISAWQKDYGIRLVDAYWVKGGNYPIQFSHAYNKETNMLTAVIFDEKTVCTVRQFSPNKFTDMEKDDFIAAVKTLTMAK